MIKQGGTLEYDVELDHMILRDWHFDIEGHAHLYEKALTDVMNAIRRSLDRSKRARKKIEQQAFINPLKPDGVDYALAR